MQASLLTQKIEAAKAAGRVALIPFLPGGYPDKERFFRELEALDKAGADVIEIGVPFSDPVADGPVVEEASMECLEEGVTLAWILEELRKRKGNFGAALVLMGYYNPFMQYGLERLARDAAAAGVSGLIVPDLPLAEGEELRLALAEQGVDLVWLIGLNTSLERMKRYAETARGFVYVVSVMGVTGEREGVAEAVRAKLAEAKSVFKLPLALGFGLKRPEQLQGLDGLADAAVFGSALIGHIKAGGDAAGFMSHWK